VKLPMAVLTENPANP